MLKKIKVEDFNEGDILLCYGASPITVLQRRWGYKDFLAGHTEIVLHGKLFTFDLKGGNSVSIKDYLKQNVVLFRHKFDLSLGQMVAAYELKEDFVGKPYDVGQLLDMWRRTVRSIKGKLIHRAKIFDWYDDSVVCSVMCRMMYEAMGIGFDDKVPSEDTPPAFFSTVMKPVGYWAGRRYNRRFLKHINKIYKIGD